ncbi:YIP1 family protein [Phaeovulum sp.]|uniref:YIP1 family protein n=1 Tax=Phaeovulum sp. TaxID=2934796 RepID=UPI0039E3C204
MDLRLSHLLDLMRETVLSPRTGVPRLLALNPPMEARWIAAGAVVSTSAVLAYLANILFPVHVATPWDWLTSSPLKMVVSQSVGVLFTAGAMAFVGQRFGGSGTFADALLLTVWMEFVTLCVQILQVVMMLVFPLVAQLLGLVAFGLVFWLVVRFTAELHGFSNVFAVLLGVLATLLGGALVAGIVMSMLGLVPTTGI